MAVGKSKSPTGDGKCKPLTNYGEWKIPKIYSIQPTIKIGNLNKMTQKKIISSQISKTK